MPKIPTAMYNIIQANAELSIILSPYIIVNPV